MSTPLFTSLSARRMAGLIQTARQRVCYAAPGIHDEPAQALAVLHSQRPAAAVTVSLDFDEHTLRLGYGSLAAVEMLRVASIGPTHSPGFRSAVLIVDDEGWVSTPTALYLEAESQQCEFITRLHQTLNAPTSKIRNRLLRISADSPDLLAVIKQEGAV